MPALQKLLGCYEQTLKDGRFSRGEKQAIRRLIEEAGLDDRQMGNLRGRLFKLAKTKVRGAAAQNAIDWLETAQKTIPFGPMKSSTAKVFFSPGTSV